MQLYNEKNTSRIAGDTSSLSRAERDISELSNSRLKSENIYQDNNKKINYTGDLVKVDKPDNHADALAERLGGKSRVRFANDIDRREFDVVSDKYIAQAKPASITAGSNFRKQAKATFEAAQQTGRDVYYHFEGGSPSSAIVDKLNEYSRRYNVKVIIDSRSLR